MNNKSRFWADLTTQDFAQRMARGDAARTVAVLPVAATEQHGPHLPLSVDTVLVDGVVAAALPHLAVDLPVLFLPTQAVGFSPEHARFPGTLTLKTETIVRLWTDIGESVAKAGIKKLVLFNAHGGQVSVMDLVARDLRARLDLLVRSDVKVAAAADPRFAGRFEVFKGGTLKAGTGLYNEPPQGIDVYFGGDAGFERAWASELGWEQKIGPAISADVTGFYRWMDQLNVSSGFGEAPGSTDGAASGVGRAYGMEVMLRHALVDRFFGWVSYTLSHSERNDTPDDPAGWYDYEFDQTHILTAVAGYRLPLDFEFSGRFQYVTGNPYTPYDGGLYYMDSGRYYGFPSANTNSARMPAYNALDLRISKLFTFTHWQIECFADVLNAYNRKNPEFIRYNYDYTDHEYITGLPIIPSLGFEARVNL